MLGQQREHTARLEQMPGHRFHVQQFALPIRLTLHTHRISAPPADRGRRAFVQRPPRRCARWIKGDVRMTRLTFDLVFCEPGGCAQNLLMSSFKVVLTVSSRFAGPSDSARPRSHTSLTMGTAVITPSGWRPPSGS